MPPVVGGSIVMRGAFLYPVPALVMVINVTRPFSIVAVAVAGVLVMYFNFANPLSSVPSVCIGATVPNTPVCVTS